MPKILQPHYLGGGSSRFSPSHLLDLVRVATSCSVVSPSLISVFCIPNHCPIVFWSLSDKSPVFVKHIIPILGQLPYLAREVAMKYSTNTVRGLPQGTTTQQVENNFNHSIDPESPCVAGPVVKDLQGNTCSTTVTLRNEKHGKKRSCDSLRKHFNHSHFRGYNSTISVQDSFYGLTPLAGEADAPIQ